VNQHFERRIEVITTNQTGRRLHRAKKFLLASAGVAAFAGPLVIRVGRVLQLQKAKRDPADAILSEDNSLIHCCPKQDRVLMSPVETEDLEY
jgi:hypothetical protein